MTLATLDAAIAQVAAIEDRHARNESLAEEADRLARDFREFVYAAWPYIPYPPLLPDTWHIDAIADHIQAAYQREIRRLLVTIQPGAFKSTILSVLAPAWRWTHAPHERFVTASHSNDLATRDAGLARRFMLGEWYQARWGHVFEFAEAGNLKERYSNTRGGHRVRTHVDGGTGDRGTVTQLDDPHNAKEAQYADTLLTDAIRWWGDTWVSRLDDTVQRPGASIVIGQRLHTDDLIGFLLDGGDGRWTHLCLPTKYDRKHPFTYPDKKKVGTRVLRGDPRKNDGDLLMPEYQDEEILALKVRGEGMTAHVFAGQYQQLPSAREGKLLRRSGWRYYPRDRSFYSTADDPSFTAKRVAELTATDLLPRFGRIVCSWDTSVKDRAHSDYVSGQAWGVCRDRPADRYLLRLFHGRAALNATTDAMVALHQWCQEMWAGVPVFSVIEKTANGPDAIAAIRSKLQGVIAYPEKGQALGSKEMRAEAASPALDGGNCFLPGKANDNATDYAPGTPEEVQTFVEELSAFPLGTHDDQVDAWSQMVNFTRTPYTGKGRVRTAKVTQAPRPAGLPA